MVVTDLHFHCAADFINGRPVNEADCPHSDSRAKSKNL